MPADAPWWTDDTETATTLPNGVDPDVDRPTVPGPWDADPRAYWWGRGEDPAATTVQPVAPTTATTSSTPPAPPPDAGATDTNGAHDAEPAADRARPRRAARVVFIIGLLAIAAYALITTTQPVTELYFDHADRDPQGIAISDFLERGGDYAPVLGFDDNVGGWLAIAFAATAVAIVGAALALKRRGFVWLLAGAAGVAAFLYVLAMRPPGNGDSLTNWILEVVSTQTLIAVGLLALGLGAMFLAVFLRWPNASARTGTALAGIAVVAALGYAIANAHRAADVDEARDRVDGLLADTFMRDCRTEERFRPDTVALVYLGADPIVDTGTVSYDEERLEEDYPAVFRLGARPPTIDGDPVEVIAARPQCPQPGSSAEAVFGSDVIEVPILANTLPLGSDPEWSNAALVYIDGEFAGTNGVYAFSADDLHRDLYWIAEDAGHMFDEFP